MKAPPLPRVPEASAVVGDRPTFAIPGRKPRARPHIGRDLGTMAGRSLLLVGGLSLVFGIFQFAVADIAERRSQRELRGAFADLLRSGAPLGVDASGKPEVIPVGRPVALIEIPSIGVRKIVVEGTAGEQLKRGPGHVRSSLVPGQPGHSIIVGRRTTYGSPFRALDALREGDDIITTTPYGRFIYKARKVGALEPGKANRLATSTTGLLTLATSDPAYAPSRALVVESELTGEPSTFPDPPRISTREGSVDFTGNVASLPGVAISGTLLFAAIAGAHTLYRRWRRWPTYLLATPPILALLFAWMEGLVSVMPSTL